MEVSFWSRRSTRTGIIAAIVLILAGGAYLWYVRATRTAAATQAAAISNAMESRRIVKASASAPVKPGTAPHLMRKQPAKEAGGHKD
jgi:hypothetical protein